MLNQLSLIINGILIVLVLILITLYTFRGNALEQAEIDLQTARTASVMSRHLEAAKGTTELFYAIKPISNNKEVIHEEINTSIGKHRIIIR